METSEFIIKSIVILLFVLEENKKPPINHIILSYKIIFQAINNFILYALFCRLLKKFKFNILYINTVNVHFALE